MATAADLRRLALALPDAAEGSHMGQVDVRVAGRIIATIHAGDRQGMIRLPRELQLRLVAEQPEAFAPANGAWGRQGCTIVQFAAVGAAQLRSALSAAWQLAIEARAPKRSG